MPAEVAPGVHRLGNRYVNCYLIEDGDQLTLVDAAMPGFRPQLDEYLKSRGRTVRDIAAVILTHAHADHVGMAESVRTDAGAPVYVHEADAEMARTGKAHPRDGSMIPYLRYPAVYRFLAAGARVGGMKTTKIGELTTFTDGDLDVPGRPRILATPGHSPGHVAFHLPDRGVLIAGDALCTYHPLTGRHGAQLMPKAFAHDASQALESLSALEPIQAGTTLFGHGDPWTNDVASAVAHARATGIT
jgi:glyoxylase-like metal-dependent hydrolase (beta-lactamase superfamily II)